LNLEGPPDFCWVIFSDRISSGDGVRIKPAAAFSRNAPRLPEMLANDVAAEMQSRDWNAKKKNRTLAGPV
jgi:hypothetical protein